MDEEIEDIVGDVKYTDSQKSVATSHVYSLDFTDSSSEKNNSSGKDTYVIDCEESDDSENIINKTRSVVKLVNKPSVSVKSDQNMAVHHEGVAINKDATTSHHKCSIVAQETFTQTSKTILELARAEGSLMKVINCKTLETQTSFISIKNKMEYTPDNTGYVNQVTERKKIDAEKVESYYNVLFNQELSNTIDDESTKFPLSEIEDGKIDDKYEASSDEYIEKKSETEWDQGICIKYKNESNNTSEFDTDMEDDSLIHDFDDSKNRHIIDETESSDNETPKSVDNCVAELYDKVSESIELYSEPSKSVRQFVTLTPLTEESSMKKESILDFTMPDAKDCSSPAEELDKDVLFTNNAGIKVKVFSKNEPFKLPPINNNKSCPASPHLGILFAANTPNKPLIKAGTIPCLYDGQRDKIFDRWELGAKELAAGESVFISDPATKADRVLQLPPINLPNQVQSKVQSKNSLHTSNTIKNITTALTEPSTEPISIDKKIKELKMGSRFKKRSRVNKCIMSSEAKSKSGSPRSEGSVHETSLNEIAERGCDALCVELLRRLRSSSWFESVDTLEEMPKVLDKFWTVIAENRIADLIRQVLVHAESPRTVVARTACTTLAAILKNTNYTKKPDFYEAVTVLLSKTGSYSRPVRRAANVALDDVVTGVELSHAVTAVCVHGVYHKSPLVRCAAARLLVVSTALGGGGRELLRSRPPSAATARKYALVSLSMLLEDKNNDARKYAERLYTMLRPLPNFEAYYLTDVDIEMAARQMKKYDQLWFSDPKDAR